MKVCFVVFWGIKFIVFGLFFFELKNWKWDLVWGCWKVFEFFVCYFDIKELNIKVIYCFFCMFFVKLNVILYIYVSE